MTKSEQIRTLFFSHSSGLGGAERSLLELLTELIIDYGVSCSVVLPNAGPLKEKLEKIGATTLIINYNWWCDTNLIPDKEIIRRLCNSYYAVIAHTRKKITQINPDVIITNTLVIPWGALTALFLDKPHVWLVCEFGELDHNLKFFLPFPECLQIIKNGSNIIFTASDAVKKTLFTETPKLNILTANPFIDIHTNFLFHDIQNYFVRPGSTKLIITGNVTKSKGQKDAILAVKEIIRRKKIVELIIMGTSVLGYLNELREIINIEKLDAYVKFIGFKENPYPVVNQSDIVLMCSRNEAFGRVTLEAMILKKPVIGTNSGGTPELIKEGFNGFLYEPGNYKQLAERIDYFIDHKEKIKELGENGYRYATENFTKDLHGGKIYEQIEKIKDAGNPLSSTYSKRAKRDRSSNCFENILQKREMNIQFIHSKQTYWFLNKYFKIREKVIPAGSKRRSILKGLITIALWKGKRNRKKES